MFDLSPDISYKISGFFEILLEKGLKFVLSREDGTVTFNSGFILLLAEVDLIPKKQGCKENALETRSISRLEILLTLSTEVVTLFVGATII